MTDIRQNLLAIQAQVRETALGCGRNPDEVRLIGVSKKKSVELVTAAIEAGATDLGENYIQEATAKIDDIGRDRACWHFIGHLQSNKARFAVPYFDLIHTVDKVKLAKEINKQAAKYGKRQQILLQVNIGEEDTKSGATVGDAVALALDVTEFPNLELKGLMCMPPFFDDPEDARPYFRHLVKIRDEIVRAGVPAENMAELSMGMSNDFKVAIEEGATLVRVGTAIFGSRY